MAVFDFVRRTGRGWTPVFSRQGAQPRGRIVIFADEVWHSLVMMHGLLKDFEVAPLRAGLSYLEHLEGVAACCETC